MSEQRPEARSAAETRETRRIELAAAYRVNPSDVTDAMLDRAIEEGAWDRSAATTEGETPLQSGVRGVAPWVG